MKKTLGGDRLGSGKKLKVELHNYERSTHNLGYVWRSSMSAGTLVPFMSLLALPGDTFDIDLEVDIKTHPTLGPLFGSYKIQLDIFQAPVRLYQGMLHNNQLGIGLKMDQILLPQLQFDVVPSGEIPENISTAQVNPSSIVSYLGINGLGISPVSTVRRFNAIPYLAYWEIYKNYYANKQEEIGMVIHTMTNGILATINTITINTEEITEGPGTGNTDISGPGQAIIDYDETAGPAPGLNTILFNTNKGPIYASDIAINWIDNNTTGILTGDYNYARFGNITIFNWTYRSSTDPYNGKPQVVSFPLENIDLMRKMILSSNADNTRFDVTDDSPEPYKYIFGYQDGGAPTILNNQEGLALKTYQSDLFNNWLQTDWLDGENGINQITAIDTSTGSFTIDTLRLANKVNVMLNRIAVSGGSYDDWLDAVYTHERYTRCESPMYMGGLTKELVFQEVVSNSESDTQPLGTLAGRGVTNNKKKGGNITVKVDEPAYIIGIISLTPRIDYSQGNKWDTHLSSMNDLHKPALDQIGFQDLITEQMAWWDTIWDNTNSKWVQKSAGKQPAWINYMTAVNETHGNFAITDNEMFMTLNRRYEYDPITGIKDLTTYIDPSKYNFIFAETSLDAQNFWAQIGCDIIARRKMSAKIMPNL